MSVNSLSPFDSPTAVEGQLPSATGTGVEIVPATQDERTTATEEIAPVDQSDPAPAKQTVSDAQPRKPLRILVVDDEAITRRRLQKLLAATGHFVTTAEDGREGLRLALDTDQQLIISDWKMPEMDGLELCRALRRTEAGRRMYVIMLTGCEDDADLVQAFKAGADDYVVKPFRPRVFEARLRAGIRVLQLQKELALDKEKIDRYAKELASANRVLHKAALTDALTGLPNRRYLIERLGQEWAEATRHDRPLACLMLDVDHFKRFNDTHGHDIGDEVLRNTAIVLRKSCRGYDVLCRYGGEEFVVVCPGADLDAAHKIAERVRAAIETNTVTTGNGLRLRVTISIGVAANSGNVPDADALVKAADDALYTAKDAGRNRVVASRPERR